MWMVGLGCVLGLLKLAEIGPVARWDWWWVLAPFAAAAIWWLIADSTGYTQRKAMERDAKRTAALLAGWQDALQTLPEAQRKAALKRLISSTGDN